jgi:hypothetical protein
VSALAISGMYGVMSISQKLYIHRTERSKNAICAMDQPRSEFRPRPGMEANGMDASANRPDSAATQEEDQSLGAREFGVSPDNIELTGALCGNYISRRFRKDFSLRFAIASCMAQRRPSITVLSAWETCRDIRVLSTTP